MSGKRGLTQDHAASVLGSDSVESMARRLVPDLADLPHAPAGTSKIRDDRALALWEEMGADPKLREILAAGAPDEAARYQGNIENFIGLMRMPLGLAGPLRVNGTSAQGDYWVPLATTEAALVASYHRGCCCITAAGGCSAMVLNESVGRAPAFVFSRAAQGCEFVVWALSQFETFQKIVATTTSHGKLVDIVSTVEGNHVYLTFEFTTGDASGQNMVTLATQAICDDMIARSPVKPLRYYLESNLSGDKKASARAFTSARGKKVTAEVTLSAELISKHLHTTSQAMAEYWQMSAIGGVLSGTLGVQGHFANGLAALYLATGQDAACVAESATGITRFEVTGDGGLYAAVTLPGIMVGTVGGGTGLPTQHACLDLMGLAGSGKSRALAEVCAGLLLGGELSIIAAMGAGHFSRAHRKLARAKKQKTGR